MIERLKIDLNLSLTQFTHLFYDNLKNQNNLSPNQISGEKNIIEFIDFETENVLTNFNLLQYVFTNERDSAILKESKTIFGPSRNDNQSKLENSKSYDQWLHDEKIAKILACELRLNERFLREENHLKDEEEAARNLIKYIEKDAYGRDRPLDEAVIFTENPKLLFFYICKLK